MISNKNAVKELAKINHPDSGLYISGKCESDLSGVRLTDGSTLSFTFDDVLAKKKELEKQYADNEYQRKRLEEYNAIGFGEQLDMIYHDIDGWKAKIKAVKDKYPKPT